MAAADLSLVVTAHDETVVGGPAMRAAEAAIEAAECGGIAVERFIALDAATESCRAFYAQPRLSKWQIATLDMRELGRTRNEMVSRASGRWIAFLDADDLFSENWLLEGARCLAKAEEQGRMVIAHPELNWLFDGAGAVFTKPNQSDPLFSPYFLYFGNYYDSLCMAPREAHLQVPYVHRDISNGLSFQDWQWGIETMAAGWEHVAVKDTIIFKRRRDASLVTESLGRRAIVRGLEAMAIDRVAGIHRGQEGSPRRPQP